MATSRDLRQFMCRLISGSTYIPKGADLSGKIAVVTGANTGLGFECAKHLARLGVAKLILACRTPRKGNAARDAIINEKACEASALEVWELDLASYQSVLAFGKRVRETLPRLDAFIANAGVELMEFTMAEGVETTLTVNVISTMLLNIAVLPKLRETSAKYGTTTALTVVGSSVHIFGAIESLIPPPEGETVDTFDMLSDPATADMGQSGAVMSPQYALSKTILHALLPHLAACASRPGRQEQVIVNCVNPGWCATEVSRHKASPSLSQKLLFAVVGRTAEQGSRTLVHAILAGKNTNGRYLSECRETLESDFLRSEKGREVGARLWREFMARIEKISPETAGFIE